jgi:hypothetical protein
MGCLGKPMTPIPLQTPRCGQAREPISVPKTCTSVTKNVAMTELNTRLRGLAYKVTRYGTPLAVWGARGQRP